MPHHLSDIDTSLTSMDNHPCDEFVASEVTAIRSFDAVADKNHPDVSEIATSDCDLADGNADVTAVSALDRFASKSSGSALPCLNNQSLDLSGLDDIDDDNWELDDLGSDTPANAIQVVGNSMFVAPINSLAKNDERTISGQSKPTSLEIFSGQSPASISKPALPAPDSLGPLKNKSLSSEEHTSERSSSKDSPQLSEVIVQSAVFENVFQETVVTPKKKLSKRRKVALPPGLNEADGSDFIISGELASVLCQLVDEDDDIEYEPDTRYLDPDSYQNVEELDSSDSSDSSRERTEINRASEIEGRSGFQPSPDPSGIELWDDSILIADDGFDGVQRASHTTLSGKSSDSLSAIKSIPLNHIFQSPVVSESPDFDEKKPSASTSQEQLAVRLERLKKRLAPSSSNSPSGEYLKTYRGENRSEARTSSDCHPVSSSRDNLRRISSECASLEDRKLEVKKENSGLISQKPESFDQDFSHEKLNGYEGTGANEVIFSSISHGAKPDLSALFQEISRLEASNQANDEVSDDIHNESTQIIAEAQKNELETFDNPEIGYAPTRIVKKDEIEGSPEVQDIGHASTRIVKKDENDGLPELLLDIGHASTQIVSKDEIDGVPKLLLDIGHASTKIVNREAMYGSPERGAEYEMLETVRPQYSGYISSEYENSEARCCAPDASSGNDEPDETESENVGRASTQIVFKSDVDSVLEKIEKEQREKNNADGDLPFDVPQGYSSFHPVGAGAQATVFRAICDSTQEPVAVKCFDMRTFSCWKDEELLRREVDTLRNLDCPGIPHFIDFIEQGTFCFLIETYIDAPTLASRIESGFRPTLNQIVQILENAAKILRDLSNRLVPVIHRDIKPANILVDDDMGVSIVDFGVVAAIRQHTVGMTFAGTAGYFAPEQLYGRVTTAADIFGLGMSMIHLICGIAPCDMEMKGLKPDIERYFPRDLPDAIAILLHDMVEPDPSVRIQDADELLKRIDGLSNSVPVFKKQKKYKKLSEAQRIAIRQRARKRRDAEMNRIAKIIAGPNSVISDDPYASDRITLHNAVFYAISPLRHLVTQVVVRYSLIILAILIVFFLDFLVQFANPDWHFIFVDALPLISTFATFLSFNVLLGWHHEANRGLFHTKHSRKNRKNYIRDCKMINTVYWNAMLYDTSEFTEYCSKHILNRLFWDVTSYSEHNDMSSNIAVQSSRTEDEIDSSLMVLLYDFEHFKGVEATVEDLSTLKDCAHNADASSPDELERERLLADQICCIAFPPMKKSPVKFLLTGLLLIIPAIFYIYVLIPDLFAQEMADWWGNLYLILNSIFLFVPSIYLIRHELRHGPYSKKYKKQYELFHDDFMAGIRMCNPNLGVASLDDASGDNKVQPEERVET